ERADARGTPTILNVADNFALQPHGVGHRGQQHKQDHQDLDDRDDHKCGDAKISSWQCSEPSARGLSPRKKLLNLCCDQSAGIPASSGTARSFSITELRTVE